MKKGVVGIAGPHLYYFFIAYHVFQEYFIGNQCFSK